MSSTALGIGGLQGDARASWALAEDAANAADHPAQIWAHVAMRWIDEEKWDLAERALLEQLSAAPDDMPARLRVALLLGSLGREQEAAYHYREALKRDPNQYVALNNLGILALARHRYGEAVALLERVRLQRPNDPSVLFNMAHALARDGDTLRARDCYEQLIAQNTETPEIVWARHYATPVVYNSESQILKVRTEWLQALASLFRAALASDNTKAWMDGFLTAFYMHYSCDSDLVIQRALGAAIDGMAERCVPELRRPVARTETRTRRIRVGVVSAYFRHHTVNKLFGGWFRGLDTERFELSGFYVGTDVDDATVEMSQLFSNFVHCRGSWDQTAAHIRASKMDVILFPEIGMDSETLRIAATRMAPLQCMGWGHPVTSALSTIDAFLSSEWMEPPGESGVLERLVSLPKLGICYPNPQTPEPGAIRRELGIPEDSVVYLCCQSLQKYLPRHDYVWPEIAQASPTAQLIFLSLPGDESTRIFRERLRAAFEAKGLLWTDHCLLLPRLSQDQYLRLNGAADVYLDSPGWSGGNTSMEAIAYGLPVVTKSGSLMRERHTAAMMWGMGLDEWVAETNEQYIELAVRLGSDAALRQAQREQIEKRRHVLFNQTEPVQALQDFLEAEVGCRGPQRLGAIGGT